jgi:hypothetical protein
MHELRVDSLCKTKKSSDWTEFIDVVGSNVESPMQRAATKHLQKVGIEVDQQSNKEFVVVQSHRSRRHANFGAR